MLDLSTVPSLDSYDSDPSKIDEGIYQACVDEMIVGESKSGKPMITVHFVVSEGPAKGKKFRNWYVVASPRGQATFKHFLSCLNGGPVEKFEAADVNRYIGKELLCGIGMEVSGQYLNPRLICITGKTQVDAMRGKFPKALERFKADLATKNEPQSSGLSF